MKRNWLFVALLGLLLGFVSQTQAGEVIGVPTTPPGGGGGGTNSNGLPSDWSVYSGSSNRGATAYGGIGGSTMGIPDWVQSSIDWNYQSGGGVGNAAGHSDGGLFFTVTFSSGGDIEKPDQSVNMGTAGAVNLNSVHLKLFDDGENQFHYFEFNRELEINWNGGYGSYVSNDGWANGSFYGSASASPNASLVATPRIQFNQFEDPSQDPGYIDDYWANVQITGFIPASAYTMSVVTVPEPATLGLMGLGVIIPLARRWRKRDAVLNRIA